MSSCLTFKFYLCATAVVMMCGVTLQNKYKTIQIHHLIVPAAVTFYTAGLTTKCLVAQTSCGYRKNLQLAAVRENS